MRKSHSRSHLDAAANSSAGGRYTREPSLRARAASNPLASWDKISEQVDLLADEEFYVIGDRVIVDDRWQASVAYFGETHFGPAGLDWVGVVLDEPAGEHQGKWHGREYFQCAPKHGLFVRPNRLRRLPDSALGSSRNSSRSGGTPTFTSSSSLRPQSATSNGARCPSSSASSLYYYDEDYRPSVGPSAESLARKLQGQQQAATSMQRRPMHGILKPNSADDTSQLGARVTELNKRLEEARSSTRPSSPGELLGSSVFNFRPRRERLSSFDLDGRAKQLVRQRAVSLSPFREPPSKGERVKVRLGGARTGARQRSRLTGVLRFMGETSFATGEWAGVELDEPAGKNDGSVLGQRYFHCANNYGLFVPASRVCKLSDSFSSDEEEQIRANNLSLVDQFDRGLNNFGSMRSTIKSPPPTARVTTSLRNGNLHYSSPSLSRSATPISYESASTSPLSFGSSAYSASPSQHQTPRPLTPSSRPVSASPYASRSYSTLARKYDDYEFDDLHKYDNGLKHHGGATRENRTHYHDYATSPLAKFDERDIELELRRSLRRPTPVSDSSSFDTTNQRKLTATLSAKPKAVTYTFTSSKYDGNPIARRTLVYE